MKNQVCSSTELLWLKAIIYRIIRIGIVFTSSFFILGDTTTAISIAGLDMITATLFYYYFDKFWYKLEKYIWHLYYKWKYRKLD